MGAYIGSPPLSMSEYTTQDSDGNDFVMDHAYQAQKAGTIFVRDSLLGPSEYIKIYVGVTTNPPGEGNYVQAIDTDSNDSDIALCLNVDVAKGEYFEIRASNEPGYKVWKNFGSLAKPIDVD